MKKIISILLCIVMCFFVLASCGEKEIGSYRDQYDYEEKEIEEISLNLYIICDECSDNAITTIKREIAEYTKSKFRTVLNVHYVSEDSYSSKIAEVTADGATDKADIILINSKEMMDSLMADSRLADLSDFYNSKEYEKQFGKLNVTIASDILEASKIDGKYYSVPNNHIVGDYNFDGAIGNYGYKYLVIDKAVARSLGFGDTKTLEGYDSLEKFMADGALGKALSCIENYDATNGTLECTCSGNKCVEVINAGYDAQKTFVDAGKYFTVLETPSATAEDVFSSAFAILNREDKKIVARAMEIIYAINTDVEFRNLLQYGLKGTNYDLDENGNIVRFNSTTHPDDVYHMNILYTGNLFNAMYCSELGWTEQVKNNGNFQNDKKVISQDIYQP